MEESQQSTETSDEQVSESLTKKEIKKKVDSGFFKLRPKVFSEGKASSKSSAWTFFELIVDNDGIPIKGFVACKRCKNIFKHDSKGTGTSTLNRHSAVCSPKEKSKPRKLHSYFTPETSESDFAQHNQADKDEITSKCVKFVCKDLRSFETIAGKGFLDLAQAFIDIGAKRGRLNASDVIPNPTTVSRRTGKLSSNLRSELVIAFKAALNSTGGAITLDFWTDDYRKISYLCLTCHFIRKDWSLVDRVLCTVQWEAEEKKTGEKIKTKLYNTLRTYGLESFYTSIVYVTDRGTNIVKALQNVTRLNCTAHVLNTVLHTMFTNVVDTNVVEMITAAKRVVQYFKQTGLQNRLDSTLKAQVETRWNSMYAMFESIRKNYDKVHEIVMERQNESLMSDLPLEAVTAMSNFLLPFNDASEQLQATKKPTLHLAVVWQINLMKHMQAEEDDAEGIPALKMIGLETLQSKLTCHVLQKMAFFLHPYTKGLTALSDAEDIRIVHDKVRELMASFIEKDLQRGAASTSSASSSQDYLLQSSQEIQSTSAKARKRKRFSLFDVADRLPENTDKDDVDKYVDFIVTRPVTDDEELDLLKWWKIHSNLFPHLATVARYILSIPASSASSERDFSTAGFVLQERRTQLRPSTVDNILFLHSNLL